MLKLLSKYAKDIFILLLLLDVAFCQYQLYNCSTQEIVIDAPLLRKGLQKYLQEKKAIKEVEDDLAEMNKELEIPFKPQKVPSE